MDPSLPEALKAALETRLLGRSGRDLGERAGAISRLYRSGAPSSRAVTGAQDALAYALTRAPATYAAMGAALAAGAGRASDFAPRTLLDAGCGPGAAAWAAVEVFPTLETVRLLDVSRPFLDLASDLARESGRPALASAETALGDLAAPVGSADLVTVGYALTELAPARVEAAAMALWAATAGMLVIVEPGTPDGWARLMRVRSSLMGEGARVLAPCPHGAACPLKAPDWCHFVQRLPRSRAHIQAKGASLPYEDEKFAYLALARPQILADPPRPRVLAPPMEDKAGMTLKLCTPTGEVEMRRIPKRDKAAFKAVRKAAWGDEV